MTEVTQIRALKAGDRVALADTRFVGRVGYADKFMVHVWWDNHPDGEGVYYFNLKDGNPRLRAIDMRVAGNG